MFFNLMKLVECCQCVLWGCVPLVPPYGENIKFMKIIHDALTKFETFFTSVIAGQFQEIIPVLDKNLDFFHVMQAFRSKIRL